MRARTLVISTLATMFLLGGTGAALGGSGEEPTRPGEAKAEAKADSFTLFGVTYCLPDTTRGDCDVQLGVRSRELVSAASGAERPKKSIQLFGLTVCLGEASSGDRCDFRIPPLLPDLASPDAKGESRASL